MKQKTEKSSLDTSPSLADYHAHLGHTANLRDQLDNLNALIQSKSDEIAQANAKIPDLSHLITEREDILADIALGKSSQDELTALDAKTTQLRADQERVKAEAKAITQAAEQVVAGLQRRVSPLETELQSLSTVEKRLCARVLAEYAEQLGEEYLETAQHLKELFFRLMGLDGLFRNSGLRKQGISSQAAGAFCIPSFNLESVKAEEMRAWPGNLCYFPTFPSAGVSQAYEQENQRLVDAGVRILPMSESPCD